MKMKIILLMLFVFAGSISLKAQYVNIPDAIFRNYLMTKYPGCFNASMQMDTTCANVVNCATLDLQNLGIEDLTGIRYFKKLLYLNCSYNKLHVIPEVSDSVQSIGASFNHSLTTIVKFPANLKSIVFEVDSLLSLPALPAGVTNITVLGNKLTSLPDLPAGLTSLSANSNKLSFLPVLPNVLHDLSAGQNNLTSLPDLPDSLRYLECSSNSIGNLPRLPDSLEHLSVADNPLYCLPFLPINLKSLIIGTTFISCIPNLPPNCSIGVPFPICSATSNKNQCESFPQIYGFVYNDNNSNGINDTGDIARVNVKVQLSNGAYAFTNRSGVFNITADTIGSYNVTIISPSLFSPTPISYVHNLSTYTTSVHDTFALEVNTIKDSISINITSLFARARPGFRSAYNLQYENVGTTLLSPKIAVQYDTSRLIYDSSSIPAMVQNGDSLTLNSSSQLQGQMTTLVIYFTVKSTANIGDSIRLSATAHAASAYSIDKSSIVISGSYDPNDKQATPAMTPTQVANGNFIDYTIRFQNTGNDTAFTVVIADTLSGLLQNNVLQMLGTSHQCKTTLVNSIVYFEFMNINLPDSGTNMQRSNGFVRFRIKPDSSVVLGDVIPNRASIYFDYNPAIVTNTCNTTIKINLLPLNLISYKASLSGANQVLNEWSTANEVNTSHFNVQRSMNGKDFSTIGRVNAKGRSNAPQLYNFTDEKPGSIGTSKLYYRLEMMDNDGQKSYSAAQMVLLKTSGISIYPNPAHDVVTVEGNAMKTIIIADNTGRIMMSHEANSSPITMRINNLSKGVYVLKVVTVAGDLKTEKLIVE